MERIHRTAIVEDGARVGDDVRIGPYAIVGRDVTLAEGAILGAHVIVTGKTTIGARTRVFPFAAIGGEPQDMTYRGEPTSVEIGPDCVIREHVTIHRGTARGRGTTNVGANCFLMIASHVAHDCVIGDHAIFTNQATIGGHTIVGEYAILGGLTAVQQRCRVGAHAFVGGLTGVDGDVAPFVTALGERAQLAGINVRGLKRRGYDRQAIHALRAAYNAFFFTQGPRAERLASVMERFGHVAAVVDFVDFVRATEERRLILPRTRIDDSDDDEQS